MDAQLAVSCPGRGLLQSEAEWNARYRILADALAGLIQSYAPRDWGHALDVGCQAGVLPDLLAERTAFSRWSGVDPIIAEPRRSALGAELLPGWAHDLPFADGAIDCVVLANVYEHLQPELRQASIKEIARVLGRGGLLVGQLPNPYFPIDSHSRLPFMGYLPEAWRETYWRLSPVPWSDHEFYTVTVHDFARAAIAAGLQPVLIKDFNYPAEAFPRSVRWAARLLQIGPMRLFPWAWQFVFCAP